MSKILRRLHEDHANLWRILAILERQIALMEQGDRPDLDIVQGSIEYFLTYPDLRHHPLENRVLVRLQAKDPRAAEPFTGLEAEHREQSETLRRIAAVTFQVVQDPAMARQGYVGMLRSFVAAQRDHVRREEESFFPAAERILDETDWAKLDKEVPAMVDPLFDDRTERRFGSLRHELAFLDAADPMKRRIEAFERAGIIPQGRRPRR